MEALKEIHYDTIGRNFQGNKERESIKTLFYFICNISTIASLIQRYIVLELLLQFLMFLHYLY